MIKPLYEFDDKQRQRNTSVWSLRAMPSRRPRSNPLPLRLVCAYGVTIAGCPGPCLADRSL
jgi:hypothetical protein